MWRPGGDSRAPDRGPGGPEAVRRARTRSLGAALGALILLGMSLAVVDVSTDASASAFSRNHSARRSARRGARRPFPRQRSVDPAAASPEAGQEDGAVPHDDSSDAPSASSALLPEAFGSRLQISPDIELERNLAGLVLNPRLRVGAFVMDLGSGRYASLRGDASFPAASMIKLPIAVDLLQRVDRDEVSLDEKLVLGDEDRGSGSGSLQYLRPGLLVSVKRTAELMIRRSDNTATNMLIRRLGGIETLNGSFGGLGLARTSLRNLLPDLEGTNKTSPCDLASLLSRISSGSMLSPASRELLFSWMRRSHNKSLLPAGLGRGAVCFNKTGDIPGALGDAGLVMLPDGRRYIAAIQVERPRNSHRANELIRRLSRAAYIHLS